jgi:hypothetical protein
VDQDLQLVDRTPSFSLSQRHTTAALSLAIVLAQVFIIVTEAPSKIFLLMSFKDFDLIEHFRGSSELYVLRSDMARLVSMIRINYLKAVHGQYFHIKSFC